MRQNRKSQVCIRNGGRFGHGDALLVGNKFLQAVVQRRLSARDCARSSCDYSVVRR